METIFYKMRTRFWKTIQFFSLLVLLSMLSINSTFAQKTWDGGAFTSNWGDANNWNPNGVPLATDAVTISRNGTYTVNLNGNYSCASLTLSHTGNTNGTISLNFQGTNTLTVGGAVSLTNSATNGGSYVLLDVANGNLSCTSISYTQSSSDNSDNSIELQNGTITCTGNFTMGASQDRNDFTVSGTGTINIGGNFSNNGYFSSGTGTVNYNGTAAQSVRADIYYNLTTTNNYTRNLSGTTTIDNNLTLSSGTFAVGSNTLILNGPPIAGTATNLSTTSSSSLSFGGSSSGVFVPTSVSQLSALTLNNTNGLAINTALTLSGNPALTLSNGIINSGSNLLTISNTNANALNTGGTSSYINGILERYMTNGGGSYSFPVGATGCGYYNYTMSAINGTNPQVKVQFACTGATDFDGTTLSNISPINWKAELTSGSLTNFTLTVSGTEVTTARRLGETTPVHAQAGPYSMITGASYNTASSVTLPAIGTIKYFSVGTPIVKTFYTYQNGNWQDPATWTLDPSGTTSYNPYTYPSASDDVYILNGRTVLAKTAASADVQVQANNLDIANGGVLDLTTNTSHSFTAVAGKGLIRINSLAFPGGDFTNFTDPDCGTVEYYNATGLTFSQLTYNNLVINLTNPSDLATIDGDLVTNGNLEIRSGNLRIGNNTTSRNLTVRGNITISSNGSVSVNNANVQHNVYLDGDLINNGGSFKLHNLAVPSYNSISTTGYANLRCVSANRNQLLYANGGAIEPYWIYINKGTDQTYMVDVQATGDLFKIYGHTYINNNNCINIQNGTIRLGANIIIPQFIHGRTEDYSAVPSNSGQFTIPVSGHLWIDGAQVTTTNIVGTIYRADLIFVYGKFTISSGSFTDNTHRGLILAETGHIQIDDGLLSTSIIRPAYMDGVHRGTYVQTGGICEIRRDIETTRANGVSFYGSFTMVYEDNVFLMSGGILNILNSTITGSSGAEFSLLLGMKPENVQTTGGVINITVPANRNARIIAPGKLWNLNILSGSSTYEAILSDYAGYGTTTPVVPYKPLEVQNNLTIENLAKFNTSNQNVTVGGDFILESGTTYTPGTNTTTFNGTEGQEFQINGTIGGVAGQATLNNLTITNTSATVLTGARDLTVNGTLTIDPYCSLEDYDHIVYAKGTVKNSGSHISNGDKTGKLVLNGTTNQAIQGDGKGIFGNLELDNTTGATFESKQTVTGQLTLTNGILNIGIHRLNLYNNQNDAVVVASPSSTRMILTAGYQSDGGILKVFSHPPHNTFTYPVGTTTGYSPVTFTTTATTYGNIIIKPVGAEQPYSVLANNPLKKYWKVETEYFIDVNNVTSKFVYNDPADLKNPPQSDANFVRAICKNYTWEDLTALTSTEKTNNEINFTTTYIDGEYTAGDLAAFVTIQKFYSRTNGDWSTPETWSNDIDRISTASTAPTGDNPVIIGGYNTDSTIYYNHTVRVIANGATAGSLELNTGSILNLQTFTGHNFGALPNQQVGGTGTLRISSSVATARFPAGDFGAFIGPAGGTVEYYTNGTAFTIPIESDNVPKLDLTTYNNLNVMSGTQIITMPDLDLTIYNNLTCGSGTFIGTTYLNSANSKTLTVNNNLNINGGTLQYRNGTIQNIVVGNDVNIATGATFNTATTGTVVNNTLTVSGNLTNNGTLNFRNTGLVNIIFKGNTNKSFTGVATTTTLNLLTINKGNSQSSVLTMNVGGTLNTLSHNWLTLTNGTFRFSKSSGSVTLTNQNVAPTAFTIPATACLSVDGTATINIGQLDNDNLDLYLDGKLEIKNGTVNIGQSSYTNNNDIEYASAGSPEISIESGGVLMVNGQIRNSTSNNAGSLIYNQTGGDVTIWGHDFAATRAKFSVYNTGSIFNMSGGTINIMTGGGTTFGDVYLRPEISTVTGGTIILNASNTTLAGNRIYKFDSNVPIYNLTVTGITNFATANLSVNSLKLINNLTIAASNTLNSNNLDIYIGGSFVNSGTYNQGINTTFFDGNGAQSLQAIASTTFYNLEVNKSSGTLGLDAGNPTVTNVFALISGIFDTKANYLYTQGNVENSATHVSTGVGAVVMEGTSKQYIFGNGSGSFANLTINNSAGIALSDDISITKQLHFQAGMFHADENTITFTASALTPSGFDAIKFITTNGVASDDGIIKIFNTGNPVFTFPIGSLASGTGKFTPVSYSFTDLTGTSPSIRVKPVNSKHQATIDPLNTELKYYWNVLASNIENLSALTQTFTYLSTDVVGTEGNYKGGRLSSGATAWILGTSVNTGSKTFIFDNITNISGDYTAGYESEFGQICVYRSRQSGNWDNYTTWEKNCGSDWVNCTVAGDYPKGNPTTIQTAHVVTATANGYNAISLDLNGVFDLGATSAHNFSTLSGNGKIRIEPNGFGAFIFPGGDNSVFMNTNGSTIEYSSSSGSTISPVITTYQNLELSGAGAKSLANVDLLIKGNFTINNGTFSNEGYDKDITIYENWINNTTEPYKCGNGTVYFSGSSAQQISTNISMPSPGEKFNNIVVNNPAGVTFNQSINIAKNLTINQYCALSSGAAATLSIQGLWVNNSLTNFTPNTGTVDFNGTTAQTYFGASGETFHNLIIGNSTGLTALCNTNINGILNFTATTDSRKLIINENALYLLENFPVANTSSTKYIQTTGLASDAGVTITVTAPYTLNYYLGVANKYTPATLIETSASGGSGTINIIPVNSRHPFANNNIADELQYYWIVTSSTGLTPVDVSHTYSFITTDALPNTTGYRAARFASNQWLPAQGYTSGPSVSSPNILYPNRNYIQGEYTCGTPTNFGVQLTYYSRDNAPNILTGVDWRDLTTWSTLSHIDNLNIPNTLPNRNPVIINTNHVVNVYEDGINLASLTLNGTLDLNATANHDFGSITGTGKLSLKNNASNQFVLPTATITSFVSAGGGTIEYNGTGNLPDINTYNNLRLISANNKNMPNMNLILNGKMQIIEGLLSNTYGRDINIRGNWIDEVLNGGFVSNAGKVVFNGTVAQTITTNQNEKFYNLEINNANGLTLISPVEVKNNLIFTNGKINTTSTNILYLSNSNPNIVFGAGLGTTSFINGPLNKNIGATGSFIFPIGEGTVYKPAIISNADADVYQAQFYSGAYNASNYSEPITEVSTAFYWRIKSATASSTANITLPYTGSGVVAKQILVEYDDATSEWIDDLGTSRNTGNSTVTSILPTTFNRFADGNYFTIGSTNLITWVGGISTDWFDKDNWNPNEVPTYVDNIKIPVVDVLNYYPVINAANAACNRVTIDADANLTLNSTYNLDIYGNLINNHATATTGLNIADNTIVSFNGNTIISGTCGNSFYHVNITGTLTAPNCDLYIRGNLTNTGTFTHNSGTVIFNGSANQTINTSNVLTFNNFTIPVDKNVTLTSNSKVTVQNQTTIAGTFNLKSDASNTSSFIDNGINQTGIVNVERYREHLVYHYIGLPVTVVDRTKFHANNFYWYDETVADSWTANNFTSGMGGWKNPASGNLVANYGQLRGYAYYYYSAVMNFSGTLNTGTKSVTLKYTNTGLGAQYDGWNLIANPFPSHIDWNTVDKTYIEDAVYYYDDNTGGSPNTGNYASYIGGVSVNGGSRYIPQMQGVFVKARNTGNNQTFTLDNNNRSHSNTSFFKSIDTEQNLLVKLKISRQGLSDETIVRFVDGASDNHDGNYDALKLFSYSITVPTIYSFSADANIQSINSLPTFENSKSVPLGFRTGTSGSFTINTIDLIIPNQYFDINVYLEDTYANTTIDLRNTTEYTFSSTETGNFTDRFILHFNKNIAPVATTSIPDYQVYEDDVLVVELPENAFIDYDLFDNLTLSLTENNGKIPNNWYSVNGQFLTLNPTNQDVGIHSFSYIATDRYGATAQIDFYINVINTNDPPTVNSVIANMVIDEDETFEYIFDENLFSDEDADDLLTYSITIDTQNNNWLQINSEQRIIFGTPLNENIGEHTVKLTATDMSGETISTFFKITVLNVNDAPIVNLIIDNQTAIQDKYFEYSFDENTFIDVDQGDMLTYSATMTDGSELPVWLMFDNQSRTFFGTPLASDIDIYAIKLTATDLSGASTSLDFNIDVMPFTNILPISELQFVIYPNPSDGNFSIKITNQFNSDVKIIIRDMLGRVVYGKDFNSDLIKIQLDKTSVGIYNVELLWKNQRAIKQVFIR